MLNFFRQKGLTSIVYGAIIVAMILVFVLGFSPTAGQKLGSVSTSCAARVRGSCIEPKAHRAAYRLVFSRGTSGFGQSTAARVVLHGLIERELLAAEAGRLGLTVSEDEITDSIFNGYILVSLPSDNVPLQRQLGFLDGKVKVDIFKNKDTKRFDIKTYERNIKQMTGRSPAEFREWQSRELLAAKMRDLVRAPVRVAEDEAFDRYVTERTTATLGYAVVRSGWLEKYAIAGDAAVVDAWARDKANLKSVKTPVRHILAAFREPGGPPPTPEKKEAAKKKADEVMARLAKGEDFAKLAAELSDDPGSKDKGGQYPADMVPQFHEKFRAVYDDLTPGEMVKEPVEIDAFGYHIIKKDPASREDIVKAFKATKTDALGKQIAEKLVAELKAGKSGDDATKAIIAEFGKYQPKPEKKEAGDGGAEAAAPATVFTAADDPERPQWLTSSAFNRGGDPIPGLTGEPVELVGKFAFEAQPGDVAPEPLKTDDGYYVLSLKERKPATREDFDKERDTYVQALLAAKQAEALAHYVTRLREAAKDEIKIDENHVFGAKADAGASQDDDEE